MNSRSRGTLHMTFAALCAVLAIALLAPVKAFASDTLLHSFSNNMTDGGSPYGGLVMDSTGNLYGVASTGGMHSKGTVFECPYSMGYSSCSTIYDFQGGTDGATPYATLTIYGGNIYGTTIEGGGSTHCASGCGTVFEMVDTGGTWTDMIVHALDGGMTDGILPYGSVSFDSSGNLYGTTYQGGANNLGIVYEVTSAGTFKLLYSFSSSACSGTDSCGQHPYAGVAVDSSGNLYGTTSQGGNTTDCGTGCGVVYELSPGTPWTVALLHAFTNKTGDGTNPTYGSLVFDSNGNLYGETPSGGTDDFGTIFELSPSGGSWSYVGTIYTFTDNTSNSGNQPIGGLVVDSSNNLHGASYGGGAHSNGLLFKLTNSMGTWSLTQIYSFAGSTTDGSNPHGGVVLDSSGNYYATTLFSGAHSEGTVISF